MPTAPLRRPTESGPALSGMTLLIAFTVAFLVGMVPILLVTAFATWASVAIAMLSLLSLAGLIIVLLTRFLGD